MTSATVAFSPMNVDLPVEWRDVAAAGRAVLGSAAMAALLWLIAAAPGVLG